MKRICSLLLALVLLAGLIPAASAATLDNGLRYEVYEDHVEITGCYYDPEYVEIPAEIEGLPVTSIKARAFSNCDTLVEIVLPDTLTYIGGYAFEHCSRLQEITMPDSLTYIGYAAFWECSKLSSVTLPHNMEDIGNSAFADCSSLTSIVLPEGLIVIGSSLFENCTNLKSVTIPDSVECIEYKAFRLCTSLTNITIPASVTSIEDDAFSFAGDTSNCSIYFEGDAPQFLGDVFACAEATAFYPADNPTWTTDVMQNYGGQITWVPYAANPFTDVPVGSFYEAPVLWAVENGITNGIGASTFDPNGQCLRAHVVTFLYRSKGNPDFGAVSNHFTDVKSSDFFYNPVCWAVEQGITNGVSATKFGSYDVCNRAAVVTFLWRAAGSPEPESADNPFTDVKPTDFFYKPVLWAIENGITNGLTATAFGPNAPCNRAQVVTFLYRAYN